MSDPIYSPFDCIAHSVELIRAREASQGAYFGDGPTLEKLNELTVALAPISNLDDAVEISKVWNALRVSMETEITWLFPEKDPISSEMIPSLRIVREAMSAALIADDPAWKDRLEEFTSLHLLKQAASRQVNLRGNRISLGLIAARFLNAIGARRTAESIAENVVKKWRI